MVLDGVSAFPRSCLPLSPIVSLLVSLCWMVRPPSPGLVSPRLSSCFYLLDGASAFPSSVSPGLPACLPWLDSASAFPACFPACPRAGLQACLPVCLPHCFPLLDGVSALPRLCLSLSPSFSPFLFPRKNLLDGASAFPRSCLPPCLPLSPFLFPFVASSRGSCLPFSPIVPLLVGWCVRGLVPLSPQLVSHLVSQLVFLICFPLLDGASMS